MIAWEGQVGNTICVHQWSLCSHKTVKSNLNELIKIIEIKTMKFTFPSDTVETSMNR